MYALFLCGYTISSYSFHVINLLLYQFAILLDWFTHILQGYFKSDYTKTLTVNYHLHNPWDILHICLSMTKQIHKQKELLKGEYESHLTEGLNQTTLSWFYFKIKMFSYLTQISPSNSLSVWYENKWLLGHCYASQFGTVKHHRMKLP